MTDGMRHGRSHEGVPAGDLVIEVTGRYPEHLHERALTRIAAVL